MSEKPTEQNNNAPDTPFDAAMERLTQIKRMLADGTLIKGEDYGEIAGSKKPTLLKPGAQKLMAAFSLASIVRDVVRDSRTEEFANGTRKEFIAYRVIVTLQNKLSGMTEAEGVGSCNSGERKYARQNAADIDNTVLKMARKRGLVDATLDATGASSLFTQDIEDMDLGGQQNGGSYNGNSTNHNGNHNGRSHNGSTPAPPAPQSAPAPLQPPTDDTLLEYARLRLDVMEKGYKTPNNNDPIVAEKIPSEREAQNRISALKKWKTKAEQTATDEQMLNAAAKDLSDEEKANGEGFAQQQQNEKAVAA